MKIARSYLKQIIKEEIGGVLSEQYFNNFLIESMTKEQYSIYQETGNIPEELQEGFVDNVKRALVAGAVLAASVVVPTTAHAGYHIDPTDGVTYNFIEHGEEHKTNPGGALQVKCSKTRCGMVGEISAEEYNKVLTSWEKTEAPDH